MKLQVATLFHTRTGCESNFFDSAVVLKSSYELAQLQVFRTYAVNG